MREATSRKSQALHEFQQRLSQRMQQARSANVGAHSLLAVVTGKHRWLFDLAHTAEMLTMAELTPVPFTRDWFLGLINHRSQLTGVIDLDAFAGAPSFPWQPGDRLLALSPSLPLRCAIRVTQVSGVVDRSRFKALDSDSSQAAWRAQRHVDEQGLQWERIDLPALMATPAFIDIARR